MTSLSAALPLKSRRSRAAFAAGRKYESRAHHLGMTLLTHATAAAKRGYRIALPLLCWTAGAAFILLGLYLGLPPLAGLFSDPFMQGVAVAGAISAVGISMGIFLGTRFRFPVDGSAEE